MKPINLLFVVFIALTGLISSCTKKQPYIFLHDISEINQISIVYMTDANRVVNKYETIVIIEDKNVFLEEFNKIQFGRYLIGDPTEINSDTCVILVEYENGDSEFIDYRAQDIFKDGDCYFGKVYCDKEEYENFINSYLPLEE